MNIAESDNPEEAPFMVVEGHGMKIYYGTYTSCLVYIGAMSLGIVDDEAARLANRVIQLGD